MIAPYKCLDIDATGGGEGAAREGRASGFGCRASASVGSAAVVRGTERGVAAGSLRLRSGSGSGRDDRFVFLALDLGLGSRAKSKAAGGAPALLGRAQTKVTLLGDYPFFALMGL